MLRFLIFAFNALIPFSALADITNYYATGNPQYIQFNNADDTCADLTEGSALKVGEYKVLDADVEDIEPLPAGVYSARIRLGDAATPNAADTVIAVIPAIKWNGSAVVALGVNVEQLNGYSTIDGKTVAQLIAIIASNAGGNITNSQTAPVLRSLDNDMNRMVATVDSFGNRTVSYTLTDLP